jgi:hypothetical protein
MLHQHNTAHLSLPIKEAHRHSARGEKHTSFRSSALGGDLHGRNVTSALMRSRVHNWARNRGGEPIRLAYSLGTVPDPSGRTGGCINCATASRSCQRLAAGRSSVCAIERPHRVGTLLLSVFGRFPKLQAPPSERLFLCRLARHATERVDYDTALAGATPSADC